ncbi:MAG TPA: hypothetical protein VIT23_08590 [Terrimicrobiaceae bacterium]
MGFSLHIQRGDGREGDLPIADIPSIIEMFKAIPWKDEIAQWEKLPEDERELRRPLLQVFDDCGHKIHITVYSDELMGIAYNFPSPSSPFGVDYEVEEGYIGTDQYPRSELKALLDCFFTSDTQAMLSLLQRFPTIRKAEEP